MKTLLASKRIMSLGALIALLYIAFCYPTGFYLNGISVQAHTGSSAVVQAQNPALQQLHQLTTEILTISRQLQTASVADRWALMSVLRVKSSARQELLTAMMKDNPAQVAEVALPDQILAILPESVRFYFEQEVSLEGELEVMYQENEVESDLLYFLKIDDKRYELHFGGNVGPNLQSGTRVRVRGLRVGDAIAINGNSYGDSTNLQAMQSATAVVPNTFGEQKVLVLLVNFQDKQTQPWTTTQARDVMFTSVNDFYQESSYQQTWLTGDVFGWYTLPISSTTCDQNAIATYAKQAAIAAGVNLSAYNRYVYAYPSLSCGWIGWGTYGGNPSEAWINGVFTLKNVGHELGHNFGIYHARALDCGADVVGSNCSYIEYGDTLDIMGSTSVTAHSHAAQKERLGWLNYGVSPAITTVQTNDTYWIDPYETMGSNPKALKILKSTDPTTGKKTWYYVELRRPIGFDSFISGNSSVLNGVIIHTGTEAYSFDEYLLDMTPATSSFTDSALDVGRSYNDPSTNVTITPISVSDSGANVAVSFGPQPCIAANPSLILSPSVTQWVAAGSKVSYQVSVTNNDSGCSSANFYLQASLPAGWSATFDNPTLILLPGASGSVNMTITSPATAADGFYNIGVTAWNSAATGYSASCSVMWSITSGLDVSVDSDRESYARNQIATVTAVVSGGGSPASGANVSFTMTKPNGTKVIGSATTGTNGSAVFKYRFNKQKDPVGIYQVAASANMNGVIGTGVTSFNVQ
ncbi:MAG TPA: NEW3 domain-containing protein [Pyrinomonadaceae bacterium]|jgi:hypothetical protein